MTFQEQWEEAVQTLLVGANRSGVEVGAVLDRCAALGVAAHAAPLPVVLDDPALLDDVPASSDVVAGRAAREVLAQILALDDQMLLTEWCGLAQTRGVVADPRSLPALLGLGTAHRGLRQAVNAVLGARGRWLARVRPGWGWAADLAPEHPVELDGVLDLPPLRRLEALKQARAGNRVETGRFIAGELPSQRRAYDRQLLVSALEAGLGPDDEPVLERALDDRAIGVHDEALRLLRSLPGTALADRAAERLHRGLQLTQDGFDVQLDELWSVTEVEPDEARDLMHDGSESGVAGRIRGASSSVSPRHWTERLGVDDDAAAQELRKGPWAASLLRGVAQRLRLAEDERPWALAATKTLTGMEQLEMLAALPSELAARTVVEVSRRWNYDLLDHACSQLPSPWSPSATAALLSRYAELRDPRWRSGRPPSVLLARGDAEVLGASWDWIVARWPEHTSELDLLRLRMQLRTAFTDPNGRTP